VNEQIIWKQRNDPSRSVKTPRKVQTWEKTLDAFPGEMKLRLWLLTRLTVYDVPVPGISVHGNSQRNEHARKIG
jgi:hypothetical protein